VGVDVNADPPQAQKIAAKPAAAASTSDLGSMGAAELNMVVTLNELAIMRMFRACYDSRCLH